MHDLAARTALGGMQARSDRIGALQIAERCDIALATVAFRTGQAETCTLSMADLLGAPLPDVGKTTFGPVLTALWIAPEQWMIAAPFSSHEMLASLLNDRLHTAASVTEQTDGWAIFDVSGPQVNEMFERLTPAPVRRMSAGDVQRSTIHHLGCFILCLEAARCLRILGPRSSAGALHEALCTAARALPPLADPENVTG